MGRMIQNNFSGGVISPSLYGRSDLGAYYKGCASAENFIVAKEGSLRKRHGFTSRFAIPRSDSAVKLVPYRFDRTTARFFMLSEVEADGVRTLDIRMFGKDGTPIEWEENGETVVSRSVSGFAGSVKAIQYKQIGDQIWLSNGEFFRVLDVADASSFTVKTWEQASAPDSIVHNDTVNAASTHWSIYRSNANTGKTLYYGVIAVKDSVNSATSKGECAWSKSWTAGHYIDIQVTVAVADCEKWDYVIIAKRSGGSYGELTRHYMDDSADEFFDASMTPLYEGPDGLFFSQATVYKWSDGRYGDKAEGTSGAVEVQPKEVAFKRWNFRDDNISPGEAVYGQTNVLGEGFTTPLCVDCFQQRRVFANGMSAKGKLPMTLWFSEVGNLDNFYSDRPASDDDPFSPTISTTGPSFIRWVVTYQEMMVLFTDSGLFSVGFSQQSGFSASSCRISRFSDLAVSPEVQPVVTDAGIVFVAADNKTVYTASYDLQENMLKPINRSVLVEHLTRTSQIKAIALQTSPDNVVWVVTDNGRYATFTFERNEEVYAWSDGMIEGAKIKDVISLGSVTDSAVDRTYGDLVFVVDKDGQDYIVTANGGYTDEIGGVSANVKATLVTLRPESQERTISGLKKNVKDILLRLYETGGISVVNALGVSQPLVAAKTEVELFTGDVKVMPRGSIDENAQMKYVSDNDKPCEILQVLTLLEVN